MKGEKRNQNQTRDESQQNSQSKGKQSYLFIPQSQEA